MKKFMIVYSYFDLNYVKTISGAKFTNNQITVDCIRRAINCGLGGRAQIYEWGDEEECYHFLCE